MAEDQAGQNGLLDDKDSQRPRRGTVYIIEDEEGQRMSYKRLLEKSGLVIRDFASPLEALGCLEEDDDADVVLTDLRMPEIDGMEVLRRVKKLNPNIGVLLITAYGSFKSAQEALDIGADDYLIKPVTPQQLRLKVALLVERRSLAREVDYLKQRLDKIYGFKSIIGKSPLMEKLFEQITLVAPTKATVLILGESGTGKELIANAIHQNGPRKEARFLPINCAA
ncbi:sigma-54-dependent transcriptional regulator, partial [Acidobacteriota bacterium]